MVSDTTAPESAEQQNANQLARANHLQCGPFAGGASALLGGLLTWCIIQAAFPVFDIPPELKDLPSPLSAEVAYQVKLATAEANKQNAMLALACGGFLVAVLLTSAEAFRRGVFASIWWRGILAGIVAGAIGAAAGALGATVFEALEETSDFQPLVKTIIMQAAMLGVLGLGVGIGVAIPFMRLLLLVGGGAGGALGGALAAVVYPIAVGYLSPTSQTERVMPNDMLSSLVWLVSISLLIGVVLGGLGARSGPSAEAAPKAV